MTAAPPRRGDVWLAQLDKVRPVVVLTRDPLGRLLNAVLAAPVTSTVRGVSTEVAVGPADGVRLASVANLDNLQLVSRSRFVRRVGRARPGTMEALCGALAIAVDCDGA
jgi:mRNA interferase MazF